MLGNPENDEKVEEATNKIVDEGVGLDKKIELLNDHILPKVKNVLNNQYVSKNIARLPKDQEPIPSHPRNVTEVRTRVGLLIEFSLGNILQDKLPESCFISYGSTQAHLDLVIRDSSYEPKLRIEVKSMEDIAEEKAPSFDKLLQNLHDQKDILMIAIWGWKRVEGSKRARYPHIYRIKAFKAYEMAKARDLFWVHSPRGNRLNAIGLFGPLIKGENEELKEEEGNMGKLTRIVKEKDLEKHGSELLPCLDKEELERYLHFMSYCKGIGLRRASELFFAKEGYDPHVSNDLPHFDRSEFKYIAHGTKSDSSPMFIFSGSRVIREGCLVDTKENQMREVLERKEYKKTKFLILENEKFNWTLGRINSDSSEILARGKNIFGDIIGRQPL